MSREKVIIFLRPCNYFSPPVPRGRETTESGTTIWEMGDFAFHMLEHHEDLQQQF